MIFTKKNSNAILPTPSTDCFDKRCLNLCVNKNITISPLQVTEINFDLMINIPQGFIVKIINHQNNNPWIVITSSIYNNTDNNEKELKISVMSSIEHTLERNDVVCHFQLLQLDDYFMLIKGKYSFYVKYIHPLILLFVILGHAEEIYYSDDDDDAKNETMQNIDKISDECYKDYNNEEINDDDDEIVNKAFDEAIANKIKEISDKCYGDNNEKNDNEKINEDVVEIHDEIINEDKNTISMYDYLKLGNLINKHLF
jgi:hypothetical protein